MSSIAQLSSGCLVDIMNGAEIHQPVLQILGSKRITTGTDERYRLLVSDGKYLQSFAMLATQMNHLYHEGQLNENTVARIDRYITSMVNRNEKGDKRVLIILELTVLNSGAEVGNKIGNPQSIDAVNVVPAPKQSTTQGGISNGSTYSSRTNPTPSSNNVSISSGSNTDLNNQMTHPISSLTPYQNKWIIRARVTSKSGIRTWSNSKGEGKLFSMDLMDESGEIRATAFKDQCDKFFDLIEPDHVYYISRCQLKVANKQFTSIKNDYEMTFTNDTVVQECKDTTAMPEVSYKFVQISQISGMEPNSVIDVIGVCKDASDLQQFTAKSTGRELKKREITLVDPSGSSIALTLWGNEAETFRSDFKPVLVLKNVKIGEFGGGKFLTLIGGSSMKINPDIVESHKLKGWFDCGGCDQELNNLSTRTSGNTNFKTEWLSFDEVKERNLGAGDNADYFQLKGLINLVKNTNAVYKACPSTDCNKKIIDQENGLYRCEKCNQDFTNFKYRLLLNICIADFTSNHWVTCFNEIGEQLLEKSSQEIGFTLENEADSAAVFNNILFKQYTFKLRTKLETFGDAQRQKMTVVSASEIDHDEYNNHLIKDLQEITGIGKSN